MLIEILYHCHHSLNAIYSFLLGDCKTPFLETTDVQSVQKKGDLRRHLEPAFVWIGQTRLSQRGFRNYLIVFCFRKESCYEINGYLSNLCKRRVPFGFL